MSNYPQNKTKHHLLPFHLFLICFALYVFRFGYGYGTSDQDEFLPYLMHLLDNRLFVNDWFVQTQLLSFSIRTYFVYLLYIPASLFSPFASTTLVYILSWFGIASGLFILARRISKNRLAAILSTGIVLLATPFWTLGGNDLVHTMLVPSMTAWALAVWGLAMFFKSRLVLAALLLGISTLFQALVGLQLFIVLFAVIGLEFMYGKRAKPDLPRDFFKLVGPFFLCASPALIPLFYQQLFTLPAANAEDTPSLFYIMAAFRNPHHYLFHSFSMARGIQFGILSSMGLISLFFVRRSIASDNLRYISSILLTIFLICLVAYVGTELFPNLTIAKLQLFKLTVLGKLLFVICLSILIVNSLPGNFTNWADRILFTYPARSTVILILMYPLLIWTFSERFQSKVYPFSYSTSSDSLVTTWIQENTPTNAIFAVPPSWSHFRTQTERSIVINHKAFPYKDSDIYVWYKRLQDMAPIAGEERTSSSLLKELDDAYESLSLASITSNASHYGIEYIVRSNTLPDSAAQVNLIHSAGGWFVYNVSHLSE